MQTDLFQIPSTVSAGTDLGKKSFLEEKQFIFRLDQIITLTIAAIIAFVIVFTFGVESGRRSERRKAFVIKSLNEANQINKIQTRQDITVLPEEGTSQSSMGDSTESRPVQNEKINEEKVISEKVPVQKDGYAIQLITYKSASASEKQAQKLRNQGLDSFVIHSGNYYLVGIKGFSTRLLAKKALASLQTKGLAPKDAYIRTLSLS